MEMQARGVRRPMPKSGASTRRLRGRTLTSKSPRLVSASVSVAIAFGVAIGSVIVNATFNRQGVGVSGRRYPASASTRVAVPKASSMMSASGTAGTTEAGWLSSAGHNAVTLAILPHVWLDEISKIKDAYAVDVVLPGGL